MAHDEAFEALLEPFYNGKKLSDPISTKEDKFQLLPAFLKVKGLVKQYVLPSLFGRPQPFHWRGRF
jgi:DNA-directed RNA polymerase III subunit RPC2